MTTGDDMKTMYDVQQLLKRFGTFIYTGNRLADLDLMESELKEIKNMNMLQANDYTQALLLVRKEKRRLKQMEERNNDISNGD
ncbi:YqgQ family protein [Lentibacillus sp. JNUCC-1]|uniref:YqgQ family protein n=1 Tax=Lentibacillus sp. JNUCC-1 TaxID=2654513 RepID=UPI002F90F0DF